jgi:hypothetical protein
VRVQPTHATAHVLLNVLVQVTVVVMPVSAAAARRVLWGGRSVPTIRAVPAHGRTAMVTVISLAVIPTVAVVEVAVRLVIAQRTAAPSGFTLVHGMAQNLLVNIFRTQFSLILQEMGFQ